MTLSFPNETKAYREARNALLVSEIALRRRIEDVAAQRRALPPSGAAPQDYAFTATDGTAAPLSSLFGPHETLALYSFMYAPDDDRPCPACTSLMDGWNGQWTQITQRIAFAAVSSATPEQLGSLAAERNWRIPLYSAQGTDYQSRYFGETPEGRQRTFLNIFSRDGSRIHHVWGTEMERADLDGHPRHLDLAWPLWAILDMTPEGRGSFFPDVFAR